MLPKTFPEAGEGTDRASDLFDYTASCA